MEKENFLTYIEDEDIQICGEWFFHATLADVEIVKKILKEGIRAGYLIGTNGNHFNGKYYISLFKQIDEEQRLFWRFSENPKFIIHGIHPYYADRSKLGIRKLFIQTRIPLRTSEWDGEYQQYLEIQPNNFVGMEYSFSYLLYNLENVDKIKKSLNFLKAMIACMEEINIDLPIYDLSSKRRVNKEKVLSLHL